MEIRAIFWGLTISFAVYILTVFFAGWWVLTVWQREMYLVNYFGLMGKLTPWIGGMATGYQIKTSPWKNGAIVGALYSVILAIIGWYLAPGLEAVDVFLKKITLATCLASLGGVIGKNLKTAAIRRTKASNY